MMPQPVREILQRLQQAGYEACAVGGCVRDTLLGRTPEDWDLTTSARPEQVMALFPGHSIPTGLQHGTVTVRRGGASFEVTTFRTDGVYSDHRHPDTVRFSDSLEEDLCRRDFTVGAMAMEADGRIIDLFGGREDLARRQIRCVGSPERRFSEDALRIMRGLRFASVLGFAVEKETREAMRSCAPMLRSIAAERLRVEMTKLLTGPDASRVLLEAPEIFGVFLPEILPAVGFPQRNRYHCFDVWEHTARAVGAAPPDPVVRWTLLFHDLGKPDCFTEDAQGEAHFHGHAERSGILAAEAMRRLKFDNDSRDAILRLVERHDREIVSSRRSVRRCLNVLGPQGMEQLLSVKRADILAQAAAYRSRLDDLDEVKRIADGLIASNACFSLGQLAVNGRDMMELGLRGPAVGEMLRCLLDQVLEERLPNEKGILLAWAAKNVK